MSALTNALTKTLAKALDLADTPDRFKDVRAFDFQTGTWVHVGRDVSDSDTPFYEMLDDNGRLVTFLFTDDIDDLIEKSSELAGHFVG